MDKVLEIIIATTVLLMVAVVVMAMVGGKVTDFSNILGDQQDQAECSLIKTQFKNKACGEDSLSQSAQELKDKYDNNCDGTISQASVCG